MILSRSDLKQLSIDLSNCNSIPICFILSGSMSRSSDSEDGCFVAMDTEDGGVGSGDPSVGMKVGVSTEEQNGQRMSRDEPRSQRAMVELPEEVLEYILSFLSPYQEHKTAALVCKQWYRLIKGEYTLNEGTFFGKCS